MLDIISDVIVMSRKTLQHKFKAAIGVSLMVYISRWRMVIGYQLLKNSNLSLKGIADVIGFSDARILSHVFKDHYGIRVKNIIINTLLTRYIFSIKFDTLNDNGNTKF